MGRVLWAGFYRPSYMMLNMRMANMYVEPADKSWTATKVVSVIVALLTAGYMLPWAIAAVRDVPHWFVFWINLLLGWTIIGWVVALIMSLRTQRINVIT